MKMRNETPAQSNHTHCQVAQKPSVRAKTCQRVCCPNAENEMKNKKHGIQQYV